MSQQEPDGTFASELHTLGFDDIIDVRGRPSIALLMRDRYGQRRSGVYLLQFSDGAFYIGLARDVVRRFSQHRRNHGDRIVGFSYQHVSIREMSERERHLIQQGERLGVPLDQTEWKTTPYGGSDFDDTVDPDDAQNWLHNPTWQFPNDIRAQIPYDAGRLSRDARLFRRFSERSDRDDLLRLLRTYVTATIPAPRRAEHDFWNVSCLPATSRSTWPRLFCVSISWMEILVVGHELRNDGTLWGFVNCARSTISDTYSGESELQRHFGHVTCDRRLYKWAGDDQMTIHFRDIGTAYALLSDAIVRKACALLNYRAMRKGLTTWARYHCVALADAIFAEGPTVS